MSPRPRILSWVSIFLYGSVLAAGLWSALAGLCPPDPARTAGFTGALAALVALELRGRGPAVPLLLARTGLICAVAVLDCSGTARALFLLVPFAAYFSAGRRAGYGLGAACLAGVVLAASTRPGWYADPETVSDLLMFVIGLVFALAMATVAAREDAGRARAERLLAELAASHRSLRAYADQAAELATVAERNRLARDIHDSVGHHLTVISVQLEKSAAFRGPDPAAADQALADARHSARLVLEDVRRSTRTLRADERVFSLATALSDLVARIGDDDFPVSLSVTGAEAGFGGPALLALYHSAQESLTNARRHASARRVTVDVRLVSGTARLAVADDGRGFVPRAGPGQGLTGMRERLELVGGSLTVDTSPGRGTTVTATVPRAAP